MSSTLLFLMVAALCVHTFLNSFLKVVALVVSKVQNVPLVQATGTVQATVQQVELSVEEALAKCLNGLLSFFRTL